MVVNKLEIIFKKSIETLPRKDLALAFSGGLDSSVLAKAMLDLGFKFKAYVAGMKNSRDVIQAKKVAKELKLKLSVIELTQEEVAQAVSVEYNILKKLYDSNPVLNLDPNPIPISFNLPLFFVGKYAKEKNLVLAQGPDEMLGGYTRHLLLKKEESEKEMKKNTQDFLEFGIKQNIATLEYFGKKAYFPFLNKEMVKYSLSLPYELKINNGIRKNVLRELGLKIGLKKETAFQDKKAAQYGSGIIWEMKKLAKKKKVHISRYVRGDY